MEKPASMALLFHWDPTLGSHVRAPPCPTLGLTLVSHLRSPFVLYPRFLETEFHPRALVPTFLVSRFATFLGTVFVQVVHCWWAVNVIYDLMFCRALVQKKIRILETLLPIGDQLEKFSSCCNLCQDLCIRHWQVG